MLSFEEEHRVQALIKWFEAHQEEMRLGFCLDMVRIKDIVGCLRGNPFAAPKIPRRATLKKRKRKLTTSEVRDIFGSPTVSQGYATKSTGGIHVANGFKRYPSDQGE
ncbi:hypothetical protein SLA2020_069940 [Shorea laevis]